MSNAKLMTPLFYQGNFNADGKKMRAILVREVSNGTDTYRLWRRDGKPDRQYPQGEGDDYILYGYTRDTEDTLYALGYTADEVLGNPRLKRGIEKAVTEICGRD